MAAYFNAVTRVLGELVEQVSASGTRQGSPWMCNACRLVWASQPLAIDCLAHRHRNQYYAEYTNEYLIDGKVSLVEQRYIRQALRRDGPRPEPQQTPVQTPEMVLADARARLAAEAKALGYRLHKLPVPKETPEEPLEDIEDL